MSDVLVECSVGKIPRQLQHHGLVTFEENPHVNTDIPLAVSQCDATGGSFLDENGDSLLLWEIKSQVNSVLELRRVSHERRRLINAKRLPCMLLACMTS